MVALIGKGWLSARDGVSGMRRLDDPGDWVRRELETALGEARSRQLRIVPVLVDGAPRPDERSRLPASIEAIAQHQALPLRTATNDEWEADVAAILAAIGASGRGQTREDARAATWLAEHLQRMAARVAQLLAASAPVRTGDSALRHINLSLIQRPSEARPDASTEALPPEVYNLEQLAGRDRARILVLGEGGAGKTSSLLHVAAVAAERARTDAAAPVPVYVDQAQLVRIEDVGDLEQLVVDATPPASEGVSLHGIATRRSCLFLFDAFNEVPEQLHRDCVIALRLFVDTWGDRHRYVVGSRAIPGVEPLAHLPASFTAYNLLRLTAEQVQGYLEALGLAALHERMSEQLRDLARNPFMLAFVRTLAGTAEHDLPRNRGKLYQRVLERWMENETGKRRLVYSYERVKAPVLSYLAMRMTSAGQTALSWREVEPEIERLLEATYQRIWRRGGMPDHWTVDGCRDEIVADDVLQQAGDRVAFRHQSFQEYFAACWFAAGRADALVELTPRLIWSLVGEASPVNVSSHRLVPVLTMMVGLVEDSTKLVEALAERNPVAAAAAIASASRIDPAVRARVEQRWIEMLRDGDLHRRVVACSCMCLVASSPAALRALVEFALDDSFENAHVGAAALRRVSAVNELVTQLVEAILALDEERCSRAGWKIENVFQDLPISRIVVVAFEHWRAARGDEGRRRRLEGMLATVDRAMVGARLRQIAADTADAARAADATRALAAVDGWQPTGMRVDPVRQKQETRGSYVAQRDQEAARLKDADVATLEVALTVGGDATRAGAARVIADQRIPIGDAVVDAVLRVGSSPCQQDLVAAAVDLLGAAGAIAKLVGALQRSRVWLRHLDMSALAPLPVGWETGDGIIVVSIRHQVAIAVAGALGRPGRHFRVTPSRLDGGSWRVMTYSDACPRYEVCLSADGLELYDRSLCVTAVEALVEIGPPALAALREASECADPEIRSTAIAGLARLGDPELVERLLGLLGGTSDPGLVDTALEVLVKIPVPQASVLVEDLLGMTGTWSNVHPRWGACRGQLSWSYAIHRILLAIPADHEVAVAIDAALATGDVDRKLAALRELSRWLSDDALLSERALVWKQASRGEQLVALALHDPAESVRREAARTLRHMSSTAVVESIARALDDGDVAVRLAAARTLLVLESPYPRVRVQQELLAIATGPGPQALRRAAGGVLWELPGGLKPVFHPIRAALGRGEPQAALDLIAGALEIVPDDADLLSWQGHAQKTLGLQAQAAASLRRAIELRDSVADSRMLKPEDPAAEIPPVLAEILIDLGDLAGAVEVARRGVELSRNSADAHALLAWSCYRANAIEEAIAAACMACDLDPVHPRAIWILALGLLRTPAPDEARVAADHALRVRQLLSPGLDTSFVATFTEELGAFAATDEATAQLVAELRQRLAAPVQSS